MKPTKEERAAKLKERTDFYCSLKWDLYGIREKITSISKHRGHSPAFKVLVSAIDVMCGQIERDEQRYSRRIRESDNGDICIELQQSLNRANKKNAELEKKIEEAKTSSGLFIDFVRDKLNLK